MSGKEAKKYDIFISYHTKNLIHIERLYQTLTETYNFKVWIDFNEIDELNDSPYYKVREGIANSKVFLACVTKEYSENENCQIEMNLAIKMFKKQVLVVFMQRIDFRHVPQIAKFFNETVPYDVYRAKMFHKGLWLTNTFINKINYMLKKPILSKSQMNVSRETVYSTMENIADNPELPKVSI